MWQDNRVREYESLVVSGVGFLNFDRNGKLESMSVGGRYVEFNVYIEDYSGVRIYRPKAFELKIEVCEDLSEPNHEERWSVREYDPIKNSNSVKYLLAEA